MVDTLVDAKVKWLQAALSSDKTNISELEYLYYSANSGLSGIHSVSDHKLAFLRANSDANAMSMADAEKAYMIAQGISDSDEYQFWTTTTPGSQASEPLQFRASASWTGSGSTAVPTVVVPAGVVPTDTCVVFVEALSSTITWNTPIGWTSGGSIIDGEFKSQVFYRSGLSANDVVEFTGSAASVNKGLGFVSFSGGDGTLDGIASKAEPTFLTSHVAPSITTQQANTLILSALFERSSTTMSPPVGWTEILEFRGIETDSPVIGAVVARDTLQETPGVVTGATITSDVASSTAILWTLGIKKSS